MSRIFARRAAGILLHPTSLPGEGIGSIGPAARQFVDWLAGAGQSYWQILPLVAVTEGGSPYAALSAMAGNPLLIDLEELVAEGLLDPGALSGRRARTTASIIRGWRNGKGSVCSGHTAPGSKERRRC